MFFTLKVLSLFFSAIPSFQYFQDNLKSITSNDYYGYIISTFFGLVTIFIIMLIWISLSSKRLTRFPFQIIESIIFFALFIFAIYVSGAEKSYYKFLFIFIIISYTVELGMKPGLIIAGISSAIVLSLDIGVRRGSLLSTNTSRTIWRCRPCFSLCPGRWAFM